jgi:hypothetical protein
MSYTSTMLIGLACTAAAPAIDREERGIVNSRESNFTESFCDSLNLS